ncbi:polysaccharide export protein EpsE [Aquabacterium sp.]|uniref:polysaccharide export protein EpsE n=1 Tax=Aquabacterium sp. TaxID=1872578 RepID=UPI0035B19D2A
MKRFLHFLLLAAAFLVASGTARATNIAEYVLGPGDVIKVSVYQNPDLQSETRVSESGVISFPLIGAVKVGGLTITQAEKLIADSLRTGNFVKQPQVSILVELFRGNQASVLGNVNKPGRYPLETADMRLSDLLATAGGIAATGSDLVVLTGKRNGQSIRQVIDLPDSFAPGKRANDPIIQNGDVIWVDRFPMVYVYGEVQRPGNFRLERGMSVMQALAAAGGPTLRGTDRGLRIHRRDAGGKVQVLEPKLTDEVQDGDVLFIKESLF